MLMLPGSLISCATNGATLSVIRTASPVTIDTTNTNGAPTSSTMISSVKAEASASRPPNPFRSVAYSGCARPEKIAATKIVIRKSLMTKKKAAVIAMTSPSRKPLRNRAWSLMRLHPV
jgi:hypothetical protein